VHLVTDSRVAKRYRGLVESLLARRGFPVSTTVVPAGEKSKSVSTLSRIWRDLARSGCDRSACVVALGGGVVGDLAGFAAASALRGIDFVQVPTTLLAMVDASVGGKTGINLPEGKNLVGAFHQPAAVVMDLAFLRTLPEREARAGWAEVIKTAAIRDARLFERLERDRERLLAREPGPLGEVIERCCRIKAEVVRRDERESGLRMILNFGHTLAHGLEAASRYGGLLHGEAVAIGMAFAAELGEALRKTQGGTARRLTALIEAFGLPVRAPDVPVERLLAAMGRDKKRGSKGLRWVLLSRIGSARVVEGVETALVLKRIREFLRA
jgi:3-dehydroquinate synthase